MLDPAVERWKLRVFQLSMLIVAGAALIVLERFGPPSFVGGPNGAPTVAFGWIFLIAGGVFLPITLWKRPRRRPG